MLNSSGVQRAARAEAPATRRAVARALGLAAPHLLPSHAAPTRSYDVRGSVAVAAQPFRQPPQNQQPMALTRRSVYEPVQPQQPVYLPLSSVTDKQVITCVSGKDLGTIGDAFVDPQRMEVVSFELEAKRGVGTTVSGTVSLLSFKQIGDVVLVQEPNPGDPPLDARYNYVKLLGMEVKTPGGRVLGKVRDVTFNPDNGAISKLEYDDFGLRFLPVNFFDTYSVSIELVDSAFGYVQLSAEDVRPRQEKQGILSGILRSVGTGGGGAGPRLLTDGTRGDAGRFLPPEGYAQDKWLQDIRRWEAETGVRYEDYMAQQQQQLYGGAAGPRAALPAASSQQQQQQQQAAGPSSRYALPGGAAPAAGRGAARPAQQPQPQQGYGGGQQAGAYGRAYGAGAGQRDPRFRGAPAGAAPAGPSPARYAGAPQGQPQQPQQQWGQQPAPATQQPQQQQQQQWAQQAGAPAPQQGWPAPGPSAPQQMQPQQAPAGAQRSGTPGGAPGPQLQGRPTQPQQQGLGQPGGGDPYARAGGSGGGPGPDPSVPGASLNGGGAMRVDEWLAREGQGQAVGGEVPYDVLPGRQAQAAGGWEGQGGGTGARLPY